MNDFITTYRNEYLDNLINFFMEKDIDPSHADSAAIASYRYTNELEQVTFTVERLPSGFDTMGEFMSTVEDQAGIKEFQVFDESTGLMEGLHYLLNTGWEIAAPIEIKAPWGYDARPETSKKVTEIYGICARKGVVPSRHACVV